MNCGTRHSITVQATERHGVPFFIDVQPEQFALQSEHAGRNSDMIYRLGTPVKIISASGAVESYAILAPISRMARPRILPVQKFLWLPQDCGVCGGDYVYDIKKGIYYIYLAEVHYEEMSEIVALECLAVVCNHTAEHIRAESVPTGVGGTKEQFVTLHEEMPVSVEFVSPGYHQTDAGLFRNSSHSCYVPARFDVQPMDYLRVRDSLMKVNDVDTISYPGVIQCALSRDQRNR